MECTSCGHTFSKTKNRDVHVIDNKEVDEYDSLNPYYLLISQHTGISMTRFGPSLRIGIEQAVALNINLDEKTLQALFGASGVWPSHLACMGDNPCANASTLCHNSDRGPTQAAVPQGPT